MLQFSPIHWSKLQMHVPVLMSQYPFAVQVLAESQSTKQTVRKLPKRNNKCHSTTMHNNATTAHHQHTVTALQPYPTSIVNKIHVCHPRDVG